MIEPASLLEQLLHRDHRIPVQMFRKHIRPCIGSAFHEGREDPLHRRVAKALAAGAFQHRLEIGGPVEQDAHQLALRTRSAFPRHPPRVTVTRPRHLGARNRAPLLLLLVVHPRRWHAFADAPGSRPRRCIQLPLEQLARHAGRQGRMAEIHVAGEGIAGRTQGRQ